MGWAIQKKQPKKDDSFGGGLLYAAEKLGLGAVQSVEGMVDFLAGGIADIFGADEWAERQFRNTWLDYTHADQWYDAKGAWKVVGDVAGGIGTSVPSIAIGALLAIPTGGASVLATGASLGATALSSAGMATSEALEKTGELTGKEYLYGALVGGTEGVIEWASQKIGFGSGRITKSLANALGREAAEATTEAVVKQGIKGTLKNLGKNAVMDFMGEATEEMIAEFAAPIYERMTINPNAKLATAEEIGYAGFVGGLSGLVMGSGTSAIQSAAYIRKGSKVQKEGNVNVLLAAAEEAAALEKQYGGDNGIQETYDKLKDSLANEKPNAAQKVAQQRLIGELSVKVAVSEVMPVMMSAASQVVSNVDAVVQSVNDFGYTDAEGNPVNITREELLGSLNPETMTAEDVRKELQNNQYLAHFAAASTFNTMMMNADLFADNAVSGEKNITDEDVAAFVRSADPNKMRALSEALGIDDWSAETGESMTARRELLRESGALDKARAKMASRSEFASVTEKRSGVPLALTSMEDGIKRYADGSTDIGIKKDGDTYTVYDYNSGEISRDLTRGEVNKALKEFAEKRNEAKSKKEGKVTVDESIDESQLSRIQKQSLKAVRAISKAIGVDIVVFESETETVTDAKGKTKTVRKGYNGKYNPKTKTVYVDIAAGMDGEGTVLFTLSHELTHHIKNTSPAMYKAFQDFLLENYGKKGVQVGVLVARQMAKAKSNGRSLSYAQALDEVIADSCESFLADPKIVDKILGIKKTNLTLWETIKAFLEGIFTKVNNAYRKLNPDSVEGKIAKSMVDVVGDLKDKWAEALLTREEGISFADAVMLSERGIGIDPDTNSAFSLRYTVSNDASVKVGKKTFDAESIAVLVSEATGRSLGDARRWVASEMSVANDVIADAKYLDYEPDKRYDPIKKNSDYPQGTVDLGNLCPKREEFTSMFDLLQKKHPNKVFTAKDVAEMRGILSKHHITVACGACFVEDRRQLLGEIADTFIDMWKDAIKNGNGLYKTNAQGKKVELFVTADLAKKYGLPKGSRINAADTYVPNQYDLTTYEGFKTLERDHPIVALGYIRYNNSRGQQAGRLIEGRAEYDRQILGWSASKVRSVNNNGGLRIFSFSDFEVVHLLDLVQVIIDCAAKGVKIQGYTKSPAFAKLVRNTGIKLNRSLIPKGDTGIKTVDGKRVLDIDNVEGINTEDENYLDEADNPNVGDVIIGINPEQIGIAMLDPNIDYIIPFHSNKAKAILKALGLESWVNYKESQHEKDIATGKASAKNVNIYTDVIAKYNPKNKVEFVEAFIKECKEQGKIPRYAEFLNVDENGNYAYREGYHKLLVDFKMFDREGNILLQDKIVPDLDDGFMAELMKAEVTKKSTYEFPQEVYAEIEEKFGKEEQLSDRDYSSEAQAFVDNMMSIVNSTGGVWDVEDVTYYIADHKEIDFIERIFSKDKSVREDLVEFFGALDDPKLIHYFTEFIAKAYAAKDVRLTESRRWESKYNGAVRVFRNISKARMTEIASKKSGGRDLGIKNGAVSIDDVKTLFGELNTDEDVGSLAERVFATAEKLGVNIRFKNDLMSKKKKVAGYNLGDMIEYKTSYFNDPTYSDQTKAKTIVHELIHACTVYVMRENPYTGDVYYDDESHTRLANAATRLNRIYYEIKDDPDFEGMYGIKSAYEMVAEIGNPKFVEALKKKNLWEQVLDFICELFGFTRGKSAYENAKLCLDYILDNPDVNAYRSYSAKQRQNARREGYDVFGQTVTEDGRVVYSGRGNGYDGYSMSNNARRAYEQGEKPISRWSKEDILDEVEEISPEAAKLLKGVKLAVLREHVLHRTSWHHNSDHYNRTDFYSIDEDVIDGLTAGIVATWTEAPKPDSKTYRGDIRYLEWGGTKKHPKATEKSLKDVNIEERGSFYIITDDSGNEILRKKIGSNGTYVRSYAAMEAQRREAREREERRISNSSDSANQFYDEIKGNMSQSTSGSLYPYGKKPSQADYAKGLDKFFSVGDRRLTPNGNGGYTLETWSGSEWIAESLKLSDRDTNAESVEVTFKGKPFWIAMVNQRTGNIEKTWTYEEAVSEGFDLERYVDVLEEDGYVFFTTDLLQDNDRIEYDDYGDRLPDDLIEKINEQIKVVYKYRKADPTSTKAKTGAKDKPKTKAELNEEADSLYRSLLKGLGASDKDIKNASFMEYAERSSDDLDFTLGAIPSLFAYVDEEMSDRAEKYIREGMEEDEAYNRAEKELGHLSEIVGKLSEIYDSQYTRNETRFQDRDTNVTSDRTRHIDKAVEEFGYTPYFSDAGYILPNGKMLNFSGEKDKHYGGRGLDHRAIATVYDDAKGTPVIARFMAEGNIRVNAASQGIDLGTSTEPTVSQYNAISRFISECKKKGRFYVDFTDAEGNSVGSLSYEDRFSTDQVITDIKEYYRTGVVPDQDYYQAREVKQSLDSAKGMTDEKAMRIIKRYASAKSYTKGYAKRVLKEILGDTVFGSKKTYNELANVIWKVMDEAPPANKADSVAEDVAEYITDMLLKESAVSPKYLEARETMQYFRDGYGRISFSEEDLIALEKILGKKGLTELRSKWGHQKGKRFPISMADFVRKKTELGTPWMSLQMKKDAEAFVEIAKIYDSALKESADGETAVTSSEIEFIEGYIKRSILNAYSKYRKSLAYNLEECKELLDLYNAINSKDGRKMIQMTTYKIGRLKDLKIGKYKRLSSVDNDTFKKTIGLLANTTIQGGISLTKMGKALRELSAWYSQDSVKKGFFGYSEGDDKKVTNNGAWEEDIALAMDYLWKKQILEHEAYTKSDYKMLYDVLNYFEKFISNYEKVWRNGQYVEAAPIAKEMYDRLLDGIEFHRAAKSKALAAFRAKARSAFGYILDPEAAIHSMEGYSDGFFTQEYENLREAAKNVEVEKMNVLREHDEFMDAHPNYLRDATQGKTGIVIFNGKEVTRMSLIQLYMTFKRQHAHEGLIRGGVTFDSVDGDGKTTISGDPEAKVSADLVDASMAEIDRYLTVEDHEYIEMVEKVYEACKVLKAQRDFAKYGTTNVIDGYYVPIKRYGRAISVDTDMREELDRVSRLSFNKDTVEGANSSLYIEDAERVLMRHVRGICLYHHLSPVIDEVNMLANIDLGVNPLQATTIATKSSEAGIKAMKYLSDMISDVQGIGADSSGLNRLIGAIRGGYAAFQIGGNPKVWATQFTSLVASTSILDADSVAQGLTIPSSDVDEYCDLAELRHYDNAAARAMSLADKSKTGTILSRVSEKSTALIGACDRVVIGRLFGACQVQAEKNTGHKIGTKENKREAGKLLEKVIFQTQQNSLMTEKSMLMRSKQEAFKSLTMFSADAMKVFGRVYDSFGYLSYLQEKKKRQSDSVSEEDLKLARKKLGKAVGAWVSQALAMVGITMLFNFLYNKTVKRDEDETKGEAVLKDCFFGFIGNLLGGMPLIRDISGYFIDGYEVGYNVFDSINETAKAVKNLSKLVTPDATSQERASAVKGIVNALGMMTGIPTRNVYNAATGLIRRFSEPTGYSIDSVFYEKNYESDLDDAIEDGDEEMVDYLLGLIYDNAGFSGLPEKANKELVRLANNGKKILPNTVPDKKSINGEEVELTDSQKQDLADIYTANVNKTIGKLVNMGTYNKMSDEDKEITLKNLYDLCMDDANTSVLDINNGEKHSVSSAIGYAKYAVYMTKIAPANKETKDKRQKKLEAIKKLSFTEEEKLLLFAKDYTLKDGDFGTAKSAKTRLLRYILSLSLSKEEREILAKSCGFKVENGVIKQDW
jgi:hypothetical protein